MCSKRNYLYSWTTILDRSLRTLAKMVQNKDHLSYSPSFNVGCNAGNIQKCCSLFQHCLGERGVEGGGGGGYNEGTYYKISGNPLY